MPKPFVLKDNIRQEETPAHVAVREALINFCIHADFSENATMIIRLYPNKIVFSNPGTLLVSRTQYYEGGASVCRNKFLQNMFMMLGTAEKAGSGVDKILTGWKSANWRSPILEIKSQPDKVELTMMMETLMDDDIKERLTTIFGKQIFTLGHERLLVLNAACADGYVTNERLRLVLDIHKAEVADLLKSMCQDGFLVTEGYGRGTKYYLPNIATSESNIATSESNIATSVKRKMPYDELKQTICKLCAEWMSLEAISNSVGRNKTYLRSYILPKMLDEKCLEMMFPHVPNHPSQKYKALR